MGGAAATLVAVVGVVMGKAAREDMLDEIMERESLAAAEDPAAVCECEKDGEPSGIREGGEKGGARGGA